MLIYDGKEFRNLEEQVRKNKEDISYLQKIQTLLNEFGIHVIGKVDDASQLPGTSDTFGNAFAVGLDAPYEYYIWTDLDPTPGWMNIGIFPAPSTVEGPIGPRGTSVTAATVTDTGYLVLTLTDADNNETQITVGYVKGPQGATGPRGIQGVKGDTGEQGPRGYTGEQGPRGYSGFALDIISILSEEAELPDPDTAGRHDAYVIEDSGNYELFGLVVSGSGYAWASFGYIAFSTNYVTASDLQTALEVLDGYIDQVEVLGAALAFNNINAGGNLYEISFAKINGQNIIGVNTNFNLTTTTQLNSAIDALILGTTVVAHAQTADALNNVSENSGSTQEDPFIAQGTGTNNNTSETPTSPKAHQLEKQGNVVNVNLLVNTLPATQEKNGITFTNNEDGTLTLNGTSTDYADLAIKNIIADNHYYLAMTNNDNVYAQFDGLDGNAYSCVSQATINTSFYIRVQPNVTLSNIKVIPQLVDLTKWRLVATTITYLTAHPKAFINYYQGSLTYNAGQLVSSDGQYLVSIGFNQWDEETELGTLNYSTGQPSSSSTQLRTKNAIRVIPNQTYYIKTPQDAIVFCYEDENYSSFISRIGVLKNTTFIIPSNAKYIRFVLSNDYGTIYKNDICLNLHWDGNRDGEYEQFVKHVYDTGTEDLDAFDVKRASGEIDRQTGTESDLSQLVWALVEGDNYWYWQASFDKGQKIFETDEIVKAISQYYIPTSLSHIGGTDNTVCWTDSLLLIRTNSTSTQPSGTLKYMLATATTEQGTPFDKIIDVDDYGTMYWLDDNEDFVEVPQGCKLFYPADYALLIDDLNNYTNGDVTALAKKSDLTDFVKIHCHSLRYSVSNTSYAIRIFANAFTPTKTSLLTFANLIADMTNNNYSEIICSGAVLDKTNNKNMVAIRLNVASDHPTELRLVCQDEDGNNQVIVLNSFTSYFSAETII